jgi:hypothetical protein
MAEGRIKYGQFSWFAKLTAFCSRAVRPERPENAEVSLNNGFHLEGGPIFLYTKGGKV